MRNAISILRQFGLDPIKLYSAFTNLPKYIRQLIKFIVLGRKLPNSLSPIFSDYKSDAGLADGHYFWQDLICARWIFENNAENHLDIGSRLDGFIAHLLAFRKVTVLDIRPLHNDRIDGLTYCQGDAQSELSSYHEKFDSVSSLHSIEHFGLGRYGDSLQADGHIRGLINIAQCVSRGGVLYVSFPIGFDKVEFNAQRIIDPTKILEAIDGFEIEKICIIPWKGEPEFLKSIQDINLQKHGQVGLFQIRRLT